MAEAIADALILYYQRIDALERDFNEWFQKTDTETITGTDEETGEEVTRLVCVMEEDQRRFEAYQARLAELGNAQFLAQGSL